MFLSSSDSLNALHLDIINHQQEHSEVHSIVPLKFNANTTCPQDHCLDSQFHTHTQALASNLVVNTWHSTNLLQLKPHIAGSKWQCYKKFWATSGGELQQPLRQATSEF